jgi:hypothetical protein
MSHRVHNEKGAIYATIWPDKRRVLFAGSVPASAFAAESPTMQMLYGICGYDAIAVGDISQSLGGLAFCAVGGAMDWRRDLGMT